ncbi:hypothetical protein KNJ79_19000 [Sphingopyxis indica]|uniref:hypothetical protein n=1 Tax=Sphingopyxis indica TaxID=436663 RepID=UPI002938E6F5|nr:hypothetical protein [Sphingopyxis indica]WOF43182.1 hypothetical protein KNJ79_19000 [Sphingopyxis indica]
MKLMVQIDCVEHDLIDLLEAVKTLAHGAPRVFTQQEVPKLPSAEKEFEDRAYAIAKAIKPRPSQPMRREALRMALCNGDTWFDQKGEPDPAMRNATGALSKALRPFAPWEESPLEILCRRQREVVAKGPYKGKYQGTRYLPTSLGKRVREILNEWGVI